ncbi:hypothetical protein HJ588_08020 [Flexivirga sp. ID2601S]|uniref:DUF2092 domain-containing protein n=1 Tax=Flexivirga aerilata TaxID=1656889 RepID=A0A849AFL7_9MICO|nr:hypothetical protein [Flexivirga aerilata]NNG39219.1 hypothetical protein [Flexivirga aerilata]
MSGLLTRRPALRWIAPGAALAVVVTGSQLAAHWPADAATDLQPRTAQQLLVDLQQAKPTALSGTVRATSSLGLPQLPESVTSGSGNASPLALLAGSHTAKVWYDGKTSARVALLGDGSETDLVSNAKGLWLWQSADKSVVHVPVPAARGGAQRAAGDDKTSQLPAELSTPEGVASWALRMLDPSTAVTTSSNERVAGRAAYQLVLTPKTAGTKIGSVRIAIDAANQTPLRAQVFAKGAGKPAVNVGFTSVDYGKQPASRFDFTPPPGAKVTEATPHAAKAKGAKPEATARSATPPRLIGKDWASVVVGKLPPKQTVAKDDSSLQSALRLLPEVSGSWGRGRLLDTALVTAVITDDGRYAAGAVPASTLYAALSRG